VLLAGFLFNKKSMHKGISIIIPTFNEIHRLPNTLKEIRPFLDDNFITYEILIVDDSSNDGTIDYVVSINAIDPKIRLIKQPYRIGKGAAIRRGCLEATENLVLFMDADHATPIVEVLKFIDLMNTSSNRVVVGVRTYQENESKWRRIIGMIAQILAHLIVFKKAV
jgi:glycosyltransferase involved in cell wall biosynthesis